MHNYTRDWKYWEYGIMNFENVFSIFILYFKSDIILNRSNSYKLIKFVSIIFKRAL